MPYTIEHFLEEYRLRRKKGIPLTSHRFQPGITHLIPKTKRERRTVIELSSPFDKYLQKRINRVLTRWLSRKFSKRSFAYIKKRSHLGAVKLAYGLIQSGHIYAVIIDIRKAFDNIPHEKLIQALQAFGFSKRSVRLLVRGVTMPRIEKEKEIKLENKGIWQGTPFSGTEFNIYMDSMDKFCDENGWEWLRYADDILLLFKTRKEANAAYRELTQFIRKELELPINDEKSVVCVFHQIDYLGYSFTEYGSLVPGEKLTDKLIAKVEEATRQWQKR